MQDNSEAGRAPGSELADQGAVEQALDRMAAEIERDLGDRDPLVLAVMIGGLMPTAWLLQRLAFPLQLDYVHASRYRGGTRGGPEIDWIARPRTPLAGRAVLVVDDILDEGHTLAAILADCRAQGAADVRSAVLVEKLHERRAPGLQADYTGLQLGDHYLFGCGMDYHERHRQYPAVYALTDEDDCA
ncbi:MAG: hypoxanthine-guanine phosphoribosyltransferase [Gammaproteobacteria bacterium]